MTDKRSMIFTLSTIVILGAGALYAVSDFGGDNLSASLPIPEVAKEAPLIDSGNEVGVDIAEQADLLDTESIALVAGEITDVAATDSYQAQQVEDTENNVLPTAKTGFSLWSMLLALSATLLGFLGIYFSSKLLALQ